MTDKKDMKILEILRNDGKLSSQKISNLTKIPVTTVHNRVKRLERKGVINRYTIDINYEKLGKEIEAYVILTVDYKLLKGEKISQHKLAEKLKQHEFVEEVSMITAIGDIILKVRTSKVSQLDEFVTKYLRNIDCVEKTQTSLILSSF